MHARFYSQVMCNTLLSDYSNIGRMGQTEFRGKSVAVLNYSNIAKKL